MILLDTPNSFSTLALPLLFHYKEFPAVNLSVASAQGDTLGFWSISYLVQPRKDFVDVVRSINPLSPFK